MAKSRRSKPAGTAAKGRSTPPRPRRPTRAEVAERRRRQTWLTIAAGLFVITAVVVAAVASGGGGGSGVTTATAFDLPRLGADGRVTLASTAGTPTVVNMFASWCDQCDAELPDFREAAGALQGEVAFVFVNSNETGNWRPMAERHDLLDFTVAKDVGGTLDNGLYRSLGGTGGMPMTAFYDANGELIDVARGALVGDSLRRALAQLFGVTY
jgi:cytochrome c biogenesis protein CcmG/thiol:disulfide interchange protein DsbE